MTDRVKAILQDENYLDYLHKIEEKEESRVFCHHDLAHMTETERIAVTLLKREYGTCADITESKYLYMEELLSAAALLHDIGRAVDGNHEENSAALSGDILLRCGFDLEDAMIIRQVILAHRGFASVSSEFESEKTDSLKRLEGLGNILRQADNLSRACYECKAAEDCYWPMERRNKKRFA